MISYANGPESRIGDHIDYEGVPGIIEDIIDTEDKFKKWGVKESGLMIKSEAYGLMFHTLTSIDWDSIVFVKRN
jgi:hypothetical protein